MQPLLLCREKFVSCLTRYYFDLFLSKTSLLIGKQSTKRLVFESNAPSDIQRISGKSSWLLENKSVDLSSVSSIRDPHESSERNRRVAEPLRLQS